MAAKKKDIDALKILIVDDALEARIMLKEMLVNMGITQIFEAADGRQGQNVLDSNPVDIILCDWNMPEMDGIALLRQLRTVDPSLPFMMISGRGDAGSIKEAKNIGVSGYILKPYSMDQLETKLRIVAAKANKISTG